MLLLVVTLLAAMAFDDEVELVVDDCDVILEVKFDEVVALESLLIELVVLELLVDELLVLDSSVRNLRSFNLRRLPVVEVVELVLVVVESLDAVVLLAVTLGAAPGSSRVGKSTPVMMSFRVASSYSKLVTSPTGVT